MVYSAEKVKRLVAEKGWSKTSFFYKLRTAGLRVSWGTMMNWLNGGTAGPRTAKDIQTLCNVLDVPSSVFFDPITPSLERVL